MQRSVRVLLTLFVAISAGMLGWDTVRYYFFSPWTRDARVTADVVTIAPDVSGYVAEVKVRNNQFVQKGDILFVIDKDRYRLAIADAEATLAARLAQKQMLQSQLDRRQLCISGESGPRSYRQRFLSCRCLFRRNQNTASQIGRAGRHPIDGWRGYDQRESG